MTAMLLSRKLTCARKLLNTSSSQYLLSPFLLQNPNNGYSLASISNSFSTFSETKPFKNPILNLSQFLLSSTKQTPINPNLSFYKPYSTSSTNPTPSFPQKPQIPKFSSSTEKVNSGENPSSIDNEKEVISELISTVILASVTMTFLSLVQLSLGTWIYVTTKVSPMSGIFVQAVLTTSFTSTLATILWQFSKKLREMEGQGQLQNLTTNLQVVKSLRLFILQISGASTTSVVFIIVALLTTTLLKCYVISS